MWLANQDLKKKKSGGRETDHCGITLFSKVFWDNKHILYLNPWNVISMTMELTLHFLFNFN